MITITNIRNVKPEEYDEIWAIVRSLKNKPAWSMHVPELSPSWDLFKKYLALKEAGNWNSQTFHTIYEPQFYEEMKQPQAQKALLKLRELDRQGKNICIWCFCTDVNLCHRSLVGKILKINNVSVQMI